MESLPSVIHEDADLAHYDLTGSTEELASLIPSESRLDGEPPQWVHYPWRRALVKVPGPEQFRRMRLDRNRNKLTLAEQKRARNIAIGVVGLSVGHSIALTLALEGLAGELRLADFDEVGLTNLNRVPVSVFDVGINKATATSRRIAEIDPYLKVRAFPQGITTANISEFIDGLDLVIEECDSFDIKVALRDACRENGIPVIMETSDGGTLDIERYDLDATRPLFHGLAGDITSEDVAGLDRAAATPLAVKILEPARVTAHMAASAIELGHTVSAWPQLGGDVLLGGATVAAAVRRLVQGRSLPSGRVRFDRDKWLDDIRDPLAAGQTPTASSSETAGHRQVDLTQLTDSELLSWAADRAPSAGNQKPWRIVDHGDKVVLTLDLDRTSTLDIDHRASAVALGAAMFNVTIAAASRGILGSAEISGDGPDVTATVLLPRPGSTTGSELLPAVFRRRTHREPGRRLPPASGDIASLLDTAATEHTRLIPITDRDDIADFASLVARSDRIRFLTPDLHREMFTELTDDPADRLGIQIDDLELTPSMRAMLDVLRRQDVMALLDEWGGGAALGADAATRIESSSAVVLLIQERTDIASYVRSGLVMQRLWLAAEDLGYHVHPTTPTFLYATDDETVRRLSARHGEELVDLRRTLRTRWGIDADQTPAIALRLSRVR